MFFAIGSQFGRKTPARATPQYAEPTSPSPLRAAPPQERKQVFSKVFRWRLPDGQTREPATVEVVGSFTHWKRVPLHRDSKVDAWHETLHHIPGNRTHHYMLLVDGQPTYDKTCDGLAVPHGQQEEAYKLQTDKGPRVLMLFAQTR